MQPGRMVLFGWRLITWITLGMLPVATLLTAFSPGEAVYNSKYARTDKRIPPGVLCKRRGILYFAGGLARIIQSNTLRVGNVRVPIRLRRDALLQELTR